jgi:adenosylhomocysteinase
VEWIVQNRGDLETKVHRVPEDIDREVAKLKLAAMGTDIDELTEEQRNYIEGWEHGT